MDEYEDDNGRFNFTKASPTQNLNAQSFIVQKYHHENGLLAKIKYKTSNWTNRLFQIYNAVRKVLTVN